MDDDALGTLGWSVNGVGAEQVAGGVRTGALAADGAVDVDAADAGVADAAAAEASADEALGGAVFPALSGDVGSAKGALGALSGVLHATTRGTNNETRCRSFMRRTLPFVDGVWQWLWA